MQNEVDKVMTSKFKSKRGEKMLNLVRVMIAGLGLLPAATPLFSATNYTQAAAEDTVASYTSFILNGGPLEDIERAFCRLRDLDEDAAVRFAQQYSTAPEVGSISLDSCTTTGLARLVII